MTTRRIELDGPCNFRDLGGYSTQNGATTRWGRLFRSDSMHTLTDSDLPVLHELGVRTAVDFRSSAEIAEHGTGPLHDASIRHVHAPTFDGSGLGTAPIELPKGDWTAADFYILMMTSGAAAYASAARSVTEHDSLPAVFFCMAGKDRTGVFAALVLGVLGVPDDAIVADYVLTHEHVPLITARREARPNPPTSTWSGVPDDLKGAYERTMRETLDQMRKRWGSWEGYAEFAGISDDTVAALRTQLLES